MLTTSCSPPPDAYVDTVPSGVILRTVPPMPRPSAPPYRLTNTLSSLSSQTPPGPFSPDAKVVTTPSGVILRTAFPSYSATNRLPFESNRDPLVEAKPVANVDTAPSGVTREMLAPFDT